MRGPPSGHSRYPGDKGSRRQSLVGQARLAEAGRRSKATRPVCGRGWWMEASATEPAGSSPMNRMTGADGQAALAALGTSPVPGPRAPLMSVERVKDTTAWDLLRDVLVILVMVLPEHSVVGCLGDLW